MVQESTINQGQMRQQAEQQRRSLTRRVNLQLETPGERKTTKKTTNT